MTQPLTGIKVLDFTQYIAGPGATSVLADMGADVIKVEPVRGEATRHLGTFGHGMFHAYNRGKRSIAIDLRSPRGRDVAMSLIADADVIVQNMRPGAMERLGLGAAVLREVNTQLIHVSITGFGVAGTSAKRAGLDIAAQAESGIMSITGEADREPQRVGFAVVDVATANAAAQAILAALFHRERGGPAAEIELSLVATAVNIQAANLVEYFSTGRNPLRSGNGQPSAAPAADLIRTRDGHIVLSSYTPEHWTTLCHLIDRPELITDPRLATIEARVTHRAFLHTVLDAAFETMDADTCVEWLAENGLVAGAVRTYEQMTESSNISDLGAIADVRDPRPGAPDRFVQLPYRMSTLDEKLAARGSPELGEHTTSILQEAGFDGPEIAQLLMEHVVAAGAPDDVGPIDSTSRIV